MSKVRIYELAKELGVDSKEVVKKRQTLQKDRWVTLGGPSKNDTAWFVVVSLAP